MARFLDKQKQMAFFYAEQDAACYDDTVELTQPFYWQFHDTIVDLFRYHFDVWTAERAAQVRCSILDVGCGTGVEGLRLLEALPSVHLVGLDFSQPMLDQFEQKLVARYGIDGWRRRCTLSLFDILDEDLRADLILSLLPKECAELRAVVTAFALHHYPAPDKLRAYRLFFELLPPGGLLVYGDLFSYESPALASYAQLHEERWILDSFTSPDEGLRARLGTLGRSPDELRALWIEHLRQYNIPLPIEHGWVGPLPSGDGAAIESEVDLLRRAGFAEVGCPYRYFQAGVIWARK